MPFCGHSLLALSKSCAGALIQVVARRTFTPIPQTPIATSATKKRWLTPWPRPWAGALSLFRATGKRSSRRCNVDSFDVIVNGLEPTGDRAQQILFSNPYYIFQLQLTVRRDEDRIKSLDDCKNTIVGTLGNTAASRLLEQRGIPLRTYADPVGAYRDLELGRIDAVVMDVPAEAFYARNNPKLETCWTTFHARSTTLLACVKVMRH